MCTAGGGRGVAVARHTKLTPELHRLIVAMVSNGVTPKAAARLYNVEEKTLNSWLRLGEGPHRGRPSHAAYAAFAEELRQAWAQDEARRILQIHEAAKGGQVLYERTTTSPDGRVSVEKRYAAPQWTAHMTHLERTRPQDWAKKTTVELRMQIDEAAKKVAEETGIPVEQLLAEAERLARR